MYAIKDLIPREYQNEIFETTKSNSTLVCLPTGTGKTINIILLALERLNKFQDSSVAIVSPTKPLNAQHVKTFNEHTTIPKEEIVLVTGGTKPEKRIGLYNKKIIIATPQTLKEDIINSRLIFKNFSLLAIDEAHRAVGNYSYTFLAEKYSQESNYPLILALTASPGGTKVKIEEIKNNLHIGAVEIRTEENLQQHMQEKQTIWLEVELPEEMKQLQSLIKSAYKEKLNDLKKIGFTKPISLITKKDLLILQQQLRKNLSKKNPSTFYGISLTALLIKIDYASELLETQGLQPLYEFWSKLSQEETKAAKIILNMENIQQAILLTNKLREKDIKHPKLYMLRGIIRKELEKNRNSKFIIFANYRKTIEEIMDFLNKEKEIRAEKLIGQRAGLTQKQQIATIEDFSMSKFNVLIGTSIIEEGLDIQGGADLAIFYDIVPSEIRAIQRKGRVGRTKTGKIIFLITNNTREQGYRWSAHHKEKTMKKTLMIMQKETQTSLTLD
ncbi:DEAD/DEAH box helicase [Candidatus Woesearchaeota archaeon]|nr:DEAD/DEAH box helicase [Candidatus Woesearchaeota archaeon]